MNPLTWPDSLKQQAKINLANILITKTKRDEIEILDNLHRQLQLRSELEPSRWGEHLTNIKVGQSLCKVLKEVYNWPNEYFIPEDPIEVVFLMPYDDLEVAEVMVQLEPLIGRELGGIEVEFDKCRLLGELVNVIASY